MRSHDLSKFESYPSVFLKYGSIQQLTAFVRQKKKIQLNRNVAQLGRASALGAEGRRFDSCHSDQY